MAPELETVPETKEEPLNDSSTNPEPVIDDKPDTEAASTDEEPAAVAAAVAMACPASALPESAGSDESSQLPTCSEGNAEMLDGMHSSQKLLSDTKPFLC